MTDALQTLTYGSKLLLAIVPRDHGEKVVSVAKAAGARGGTIMPGRGTAERYFLHLLGLGDSHKDIVLILLGQEECHAVLDSLGTDPHFYKKKLGIGLVLNVRRMVKRVFTLDEASSPTHRLNSEETKRVNTAEHELITVIVNAGYADDIMASARQAGATGGTIVNARGTGKEEDVTFFGLTLVPEKEILLILTSKDNAENLLQTIRRMPFLTEPGIGIAFCIDVELFLQLGQGAVRLNTA